MGGNCKNHACSVCQGACSSDNECEGELFCFERQSGESVPGCKDNDAVPGNMNICANKQAANELRELGADYCSPNKKCDNCRGDCDIDSDCKSGNCFQRSSRNSFEEVPGCDKNFPITADTDFCISK